MKMEAGQWIRLTKKAQVNPKYRGKTFKVVNDTDEYLTILDENGIKITAWTIFYGDDSSFYWECEPAVPPNSDFWELNV